jgi:hypothetical protein
MTAIADKIRKEAAKKQKVLMVESGGFTHFKFPGSSVSDGGEVHVLF